MLFPVVESLTLKMYNMVGRGPLVFLWIPFGSMECGPKKARSHFPQEIMVLASFGFLGVSARPRIGPNQELGLGDLYVVELFV